MANIIFARGQHTTAATGTANQSTTCELFLWNEPSSVPGSPNYVFSKKIPSSLITTVRYNIAPYIRQFISHLNFIPSAGQGVFANGEYCYARVKVYVAGVLQYTTDYTCFDGYAFYDNTRNIVTSGSFMMLDQGTYQVNETGLGGRLHIFKGNLNAWTAEYYGIKSGNLLITKNFSTNTATIPYIDPLANNDGGNIIKIYDQLAVLRGEYRMETVCESKYTPVNCDFVNRYGMWQRIIFFKANQKSTTSNNTKYNLMSQSIPFNFDKGLTQVFNVNARDTRVVNTGWVPESYRFVIEQLMLSEVIKLDDKPVTLDTSNIVQQRHINDQLINYNLSFSYAYETINDIT